MEPRQIVLFMLSSNISLLLLEAVVYLSAIAFALSFPRRGMKWVTLWRDRYCRFARRRALSVAAVIAFVLVVRGALIPMLPTPVPGVHDEFSYLLAADTFASGRVTNPAHLLWKSLETFYVIQQPTYASMYPPAQGLAIAVGDLLGGHPWLGVYISIALMCGSICWMLQGWVPPQWALTGAMIAALRWGIYSYWSESYWGGAVAAIGGALVLGALPRLLRAPSRVAALVLALGVLVLANSRPFEGLLVAAPVLGWLAWHFLKIPAGQRSIWFRRVALPIAGLLGLGLLCMIYYFWRVTGNPFIMPYKLHSATYEITDPFLWQKIRKAPTYRYWVMEKYHVERQTAAYERAHSLKGFITETVLKAESLTIFYLWPAVLPTLFALPFLWRNFKVRVTLAFGLLMFAGLAVEIWPMTLHYHAPITAVAVLLLVQVMRFWRTRKWNGRPVGAAVCCAIPLFCLCMLTFRLAAAVSNVPVPEHGLAPWFTVVSGNLHRDEISRYLEAQPGQQLVLVHYSKAHHVDEEWVHNAADIDSSKIVWARYAGTAENARVLEYFRQRHAWMVEVGEKSGQLKPLQATVNSVQFSK